MGIVAYDLGSVDETYWYWVVVPRGVRSNKRRVIKKYFKKTGWLKVGKSQYRYMFNRGERNGENIL